MVMFHASTATRQRRSELRDVRDFAAQTGVANSQRKERRLRAHVLRHSVHSGAFQKKPRGRPSASQASRAFSYSARTTRSNAENAYSSAAMARTIPTGTTNGIHCAKIVVTPNEPS